MSELDKELLKKLTSLMNGIEKSKNVELMKAATDFLKVFKTYAGEILKPLNKTSAIFLQNRSLETWDTVWRNE